VARDPVLVRVVLPERPDEAAADDRRPDAPESVERPVYETAEQVGRRPAGERGERDDPGGQAGVGGEPVEARPAKRASAPTAAVSNSRWPVL